jgi:competence protein ComEC
LLVRYRDQSILLPGDIESTIENQLLSQQQFPEKLTLLLAAHHGSRTSSGIGFVNHTKPEYVIYSTGYHNRHGHPHLQVQQRFQRVASRELNTATSGALVFAWFDDRPVRITAYRRSRHRYWYE